MGIVPACFALVAAVFAMEGALALDDIAKLHALV